MFITTYHYITDPRDAYALHGPAIPEFLAQVDSFSQEYDIKDITQISGQQDSSRDCIALSFDDGTFHHYRMFPELRKRNIIASFFPIACVFDGIVPITIQTHIVLSKLAPEVIAAKIEREYPSIVKRIAHEDGIPRKRRLSPLKAMYDEVFAANIKVVIADFPVAEKELVIQPLFWEAIDGTVDDFIKTFFMQPEQLKEMHEAGMIIGAHSYAHTSLKSLSYEEQKKDIAKSKDIIEGIIKSKISAFSYPFGYYDQNTLTIMRELGFRYGVLFNHQPLGPEPDNLLLSAYDYRDIRQHKKL